MRLGTCSFIFVCILLSAIVVVRPAQGQTPCGGAPGPDVIVGIITGPENYTATGIAPNNFEALSLGTTSCNMGTANLKWDACPANTHPVIGGTLFRYSTVSGSGRFEQVGQSWLKHGFLALTNSDCCPCQNPGTGSRLGIGCSDPYSASRNGSQSGLGPKYTVNAHTGAYPASCPTHPSGGNNGRIEVRISDLVATTGGPAATTRYFGQAQYVTPDDASSNNQNNNCSYIEVTVSGSASAWTFGFMGSTVKQFPAVNMWKAIDPSVVQSNLDVPEDNGLPGRVVLCGRATSLGGGQYHYEYALYNMNSDRSIQSFSIPVSPYATITNVGFRDVDYRGGDGGGGVNYDGTDWSATIAGGSIGWATQTYATNTNANALRWGTMYSFRFDANLANAVPDGIATMVQFKPGATTFTGATPVPAIVTCTRGDVNGDGVIDGGDISLFSQILVNGSGTPPQKCAMDADGNFSVNSNDIEPFGTCLLNSGC